MSKELVEQRAALSPEQLKALSAEELLSVAVSVEPKGKSKNPIAHLTINLTDMALRAQEIVRSGEYDNTRFYVGIVMSPEIYIHTMMTAAAIAQSAGGDDTGEPNEASRAMIVRAIADASAATAGNNTGPTSQGWGGVSIFPDARAKGFSIGVLQRNPDEAPQTFDEKAFNELKANFEQMLVEDANLAQHEALDARGTVSGVVGRA